MIGQHLALLASVPVVALLTLALCPRRRPSLKQTGVALLIMSVIFVFAYPLAIHMCGRGLGYTQMTLPLISALCMLLWIEHRVIRGVACAAFVALMVTLTGQYNEIVHRDDFIGDLDHLKFLQNSRDDRLSQLGQALATLGADDTTVHPPTMAEALPGHLHSLSCEAERSASPTSRPSRGCEAQRSRQQKSIELLKSFDDLLFNEQWSPESLWHTPVSRIYALETQRVVLWFEGGTLSEAPHKLIYRDWPLQ